jgi:hypothetical protein
VPADTEDPPGEEPGPIDPRCARPRTGAAGCTAVADCDVEPEVAVEVSVELFDAVATSWCESFDAEARMPPPIAPPTSATATAATTLRLPARDGLDLDGSDTTASSRSSSLFGGGSVLSMSHMVFFSRWCGIRPG